MLEANALNKGSFRQSSVRGVEILTKNLKEFKEISQFKGFTSDELAYIKQLH
jgi:hypothetical protein